MKWNLKDFNKVYSNFFSTSLPYAISSIATRDLFYQELREKHKIDNLPAAAFSGLVGAVVSLPFFKSQLLNSSQEVYTL